MPKQPFTHKPNVPRRGANPAREQHGEKVKPQKILAGRKTK
jgi:hypothetical protein